MTVAALAVVPQYIANIITQLGSNSYFANTSGSILHSSKYVIDIATGTRQHDIVSATSSHRHSINHRKVNSAAASRLKCQVERLIAFAGHL